MRFLNIVLYITVLSLCAWADTKPTLKIGVILPMSGNNAYLGENARDGILLRAKEISSNSRFDYQLIFEDDGMAPGKTNLAARKLRSVDHADVVFSLWGASHNIVIAALKGSGILHMSLDAWTDPSSYPADFVLCAPYEAYAEKMAEAVEARGAKTAVFFGVASPDERHYCAALKRDLAARHIQLIDEHYTNFDVRDFRTYILKVRDLHPDIFIATAVQPMMELALRQMRDIGYHPPLAGASANFLDISDRTLIENSFYVLTPPDPDWFVKKFAKLYGKAPAYPASNGYDALSLLINACEACPGPKPTTEQIAVQLRQVKHFAGALGDTSYEAPNKLPTPVVCYLIKNGQPQMISLQDLKRLDVPVAPVK